MIDQIARTTAVACVALAAMFAWWRGTPAAALAVVGGGALVALSGWAIRGAVDGLIGTAVPSKGAEHRANVGETGAKPAGFPLVKFFTRHAILALAAYGMMVRLHFDPLGLLVGVSSLGIAVGVVALKDLRRRFQ